MGKLKLFILFAIAGSAFGQAQIPWRASVTASVGASSSYTFTVQQSAGGNVQNLQSAVISCGTNTFTVGQSQNGTAASATQVLQATTGTVATSANSLVALSPWALNTPLSVTAWSSSNVGTGVATSGVQPYSSIALIGLTGRVLSVAGTTQNYSFTVTNTGSGSCSLVIDVYGVQTQ